MTWHDARGDSFNNNLTQFWGAASDTGGASFGANFRISAGISNDDSAGSTVDYGDYTSSDFYNGQLHVIWADNSNITGDNPAGANSTFDMYTAAVTILAPEPPSCYLTNNVDYGVVPVATTLAWTSANATSLSIDNGIGPVAPVANGSITFSPVVETIYTATASGPGGITTCATIVSSIPLGSSTLVWNSWDVQVSDGGGGGVVVSPNPGSSPEIATVEYYESINNGGVLKGALFSDTGALTTGTHPEAFNKVEDYWGPGTGRVYPYAGKSTVNRGADVGEANTPLPLGVRDLQLHPPNSLHLVVAAFRVPRNGTYTISNLGVRRVHDLGGPVGFHVFNAQQVEIAGLQATANRAWVTSPTTYTLPDLTEGSYLYFAVDRAGNYAFDATEISWTVKKPIEFPPPLPLLPMPSCTLAGPASAVQPGLPASLTWMSANATSLSIDHGVGAVASAPSGAVDIFGPSVATLYTMTAAGPGGMATCATTVAATSDSVALPAWNSWDIVTQAGATQGTVTAAETGTVTSLEFYESTNNRGVTKGALFGSFNPGTHPQAFNNLQQYWGPGTGSVYPYAGKSTVNRGSGTGETNSPMPLGVRDLQLHPPNNLHNVVAAFKVPMNGTYTISNLAMRRVHNLGGPAVFHVFNAQQVEIATLKATPNRAWTFHPAIHTLSGLTAGSYLYFAVNRDTDYAYDAIEIAWTVTRTGP